MQARILYACSGVILIVVGLLQFNPLADVAKGASRDLALGVGTVYVSLRVINGALSTAQEFELGVSAVGAANEQPLKVLEPIDDTIERIAGAIFLISAASWLLSISCGPVASLGAILVGLALLGRALLLNRFKYVDEISLAAIRSGLIICVALPLIFSVGIGVGGVVTKQLQDEAAGTLSSVADESGTMIRAQNGSIDDESLVQERGWFGSIGEGMSSTVDQFSRFTGAASYYWSNADKILEASFTLIAIFILRNV